MTYPPNPPPINYEDELYNSNNEETPLLEDNTKLAKLYSRNSKKKVVRNTRLSILAKCSCCAFLTLFLLISLNLVYFSFSVNNQMHLSFSNSDTTNLTATWVSLFNPNNKPLYLEVYNSNLSVSNLIQATVTYYCAPGSLSRYIMEATINTENYKFPIQYRINSRDFVSNYYTATLPTQNNSKNLIIYADMGYLFDYAAHSIHNEVDTGNYDLIFHVGDIAYNMDWYFGTVSDLFFSEIEGFSSKIPYMVVPGNHENANNFSFYKNLFNMPDKNEYDNLFYSLDIPPIKMININTEAYYFKSLEPTIETQYNFIINELNTTDRKLFPWLIVTGHRPMYCSSDDNDDCVSWKKDKLRLALESVFYKYNVTLFISGHEHKYERVCPVFNGVCQNTSSIYNYKLNGLLPIHIITGAAGNIEGLGGFNKSPNNFSLVRIKNYGYGTLLANYSQLNWKQKGLDMNVLDEFTIFA